MPSTTATSQGCWEGGFAHSFGPSPCTYGTPAGKVLGAGYAAEKKNRCKFLPSWNKPPDVAANMCRVATPGRVWAGARDKAVRDRTVVVSEFMARGEARHTGTHYHTDSKRGRKHV